MLVALQSLLLPNLLCVWQSSFGDQDFLAAQHESIYTHILGAYLVLAEALRVSTA
jgi:hypothetical protein